MEQEARSNRPSFLVHPIEWTRAWASTPPSTATTAVISVLCGYVALLGLVVGGAVLAALKGDVKVAGWLVAAAVGVALIIGVASGFALVRALFAPQIKASDAAVATAIAEAEAARAETATARAEATLERERRESVEPEAKAMERFGIYADYAYRLLDDISTNLSEFYDLGSGFSSGLCALPSDVIKKTTGVPAMFSVWFEGNPKQWREKIPFESAKEQVRTFWIACAPDHTDREKQDFQVGVRNSWLALSRQLQDDDPSGSERIFKVDDLGIAALRGPDIDAFRKHEYQAVFATCFRFGERRGFLVALSRVARPFSKAELRFLELLAACMNTVSDLAAARGLLSD